MNSQLRAIALAITLIDGLGTVGAGTATAAPGDNFYTPPAKYSSTPGAILKSRGTPLLLQIPADPRPFPGKGSTIMYTSTLQDGSPTAVTGTVIKPFAPGADADPDRPS